MTTTLPAATAVGALPRTTSTLSGNDEVVIALIAHIRARLEHDA